MNKLTSGEIELTKQEKNAIASLKRLAKRWPKSLWIFAASGSLCVMRCDEDGNQVMNSDDCRGGGGVDQDYIVGSADIPIDGGDW